MRELVCDRGTVTAALTGVADSVCARQLDGIACLVDGRAVAAFGFEHFNGSNVDVHFMIKYPAPAWIRAVLLHIRSMGVLRITAPIHESNMVARKVFEKVGAEIECVCKHGYEDGDMIRYVLWTKLPPFANLLHRFGITPLNK